MRSTVLTLALDEGSQERFEALRQQHFPPALNRIVAHLTLFHTLRAEESVASVLRDAAERTEAFELNVTGLMPLGRGVAYRLESAPAITLQRELAGAFDPDLSAQDRQRFRPHVVVQNKATPEQARALLAELSAGFAPWTVTAVALDWWDYLGGPWRLRERFGFRKRGAGDADSGG